MNQEPHNSRDDSTVLAPRLPSQVGPYILKRRLGSGGMGTVFEAIHGTTGETVAVKILNPAMTSESALRRFEIESKILARLRHPNIAQVYDAGIYDDGSVAVPYFVMEFIPEAQSITEYARQRALNRHEKLKLFATVCEAVHHGNEHGVVHRDLKPANILVDSSGRVMVIDFGVARTTDADLAATSQRTRSGELIGTLAYMSPEQVEGKAREIDARSDVYSLGVVLYELLAGHLPYDLDGVPDYEVLRVIREKSPLRLARRDASLGGDLETLVHTALHKDRQWRYQSADEFRRNILRYLDNQPLPIRKPPLKYKIETSRRTFIRKHPIVAYLLAGVIAAVCAQYIGVRLVFSWTYLNVWYTKTMMSLAWPTTNNQPLEHVRVIRITEDTVNQIDQIARAENLEGVTSQNIPSWRRLHGILMERLAHSGVRAVAFDLMFPGETEYDADFVRGVQALNDAGIDTIVTIGYWGFEDDGRSGVSSHIVRSVKWGTPTAQLDNIRWQVDLIVQRAPLDPLPSFALASATSFLQPQHESALTLDPKRHGLSVSFFKRADPDDSRAKVWTPTTAHIELSLVHPLEELPSHGLQTGDLIGYYLVALANEEALAASTLDYESVFTMDNPTLREHFHGKLALIGYTFPHDDIYHAPGGRMVNGVYAHAAAIDATLQQQPILLARFPFFRFSLVTSAFLGVLIGWIAMRSHRWAFVLLTFLIILSLLASAISYVEWRYMYNPFAPLLALAVGFVLALQINRTHPPRVHRSSCP